MKAAAQSFQEEMAVDIFGHGNFLPVRLILFFSCLSLFQADLIQIGTKIKSALHLTQDVVPAHSSALRNPIRVVDIPST